MDLLAYWPALEVLLILSIPENTIFTFVTDTVD